MDLKAKRKQLEGQMEKLDHEVSKLKVSVERGVQMIAAIQGQLALLDEMEREDQEEDIVGG